MRQSDTIQRQQPFLHQWGPPIGLCLTLFIVSFNVSVVPAIMPRIVRDLNSSMGYVQGALVLIAIVKASFAPTCENLSQRYGRKLIFLAGLGLFALGTIATSLSPTTGAFVVAYALITGLGAVPLIASPRDLIDRIYDDKAELYAQLALVVSSVLGGLIGALLGGFIASQVGWRWAFVPQLLLIPVIVFLIRTVPKTPGLQTQPLDWVGGVFSFLGFGLTLLGISLAGEYGWWKPKQLLEVLGVVVPPFPLSVVPPLIGLGVICLGIFVVWQKRQANRGKASLLRIGLLRHKPFLLALFIATLHTLITTGIQFNLYQFIPAILNLNPFQTALAVLPFSLAVLVVVVYTTFKVVGRIAPKLIIYAGLSLFCMGSWHLYRVIDLNLTALKLLPALVIMGAGSGLFLAQIGMTAISIAKPDERVEAGSIYTPFQNLGSALGRALLGTMLITIASIQIVDRVVSELGKTISPTQRAEAIVLLQRVIQTYTQEEKIAFFKELPAAVLPSLGSIIDLSALEAMRTVVLIAFGLSVLCLGLSLFLPKRPVKRR